MAPHTTSKNSGRFSSSTATCPPGSSPYDSQQVGHPARPVVELAVGQHPSRATRDHGGSVGRLGREPAGVFDRTLAHGSPLMLLRSGPLSLQIDTR